MAAVDHLSKQFFWHGTNRPIKRGEIITPGHRSHHVESHPEFAYASRNFHDALFWADKAVEKHGGEHHVYEVTPVAEDVEEDPNFAFDKEAVEKEIGPVRSKSGFKVKSRIA